MINSPVSCGVRARLGWVRARGGWVLALPQERQGRMMGRLGSVKVRLGWVQARMGWGLSLPQQVTLRLGRA
jgi:hypothetical protein